MLDIHAHILPGVDDGARSNRQSLQMLQMARAAGIDTLVATPHIRRVRDGSRDIEAAFTWLQPYAREAGIRLMLGYEVSYRVLPEFQLPELRRLCIAGTNILLLELDATHLFPQWNRVLSGLTRAGYQPVIVHPERYVYIQEHPELVEKMRRYGCKIQIDAQAFLKPPWNRERRTAGRLLCKGWMDYIASDAHRPQDYLHLQRAHRRLKGSWPKAGIS